MHIEPRDAFVPLPSSRFASLPAATRTRSPIAIASIASHSAHSNPASRTFLQLQTEPVHIRSRSTAPDSKEVIQQRAGQVWYPDSAFKVRAKRTQRERGAALAIGSSGGDRCGQLLVMDAHAQEEVGRPMTTVHADVDVTRVATDAAAALAVRFPLSSPSLLSFCVRLPKAFAIVSARICL